MVKKRYFIDPRFMYYRDAGVRVKIVLPATRKFKQWNRSAKRRVRSFYGAEEVQKRWQTN